jgi:hypothetical protein
MPGTGSGGKTGIDSALLGSFFVIRQTDTSQIIIKIKANK